MGAAALRATEAARAVACPACLSPSGQPCTQPTASGRTPVAWHHYSREHAVS